ncbi:hypothetical protein ACHAXT_004786 [Thalassiosira profunda]
MCPLSVRLPTSDRSYASAIYLTFDASSTLQLSPPQFEVASLRTLTMGGSRPLGTLFSTNNAILSGRHVLQYSLTGKKQRFSVLVVRPVAIVLCLLGFLNWRNASYSRPGGVALSSPLPSFFSPSLEIVDERIQREALDEVGITKAAAHSFDSTLIPISGYRHCLTHNDARSIFSYMGNPGEHCEQCIQVDANATFKDQSVVACRSKSLVCGQGSTFYCGLLGFTTKTPILVSEEVLQSWPKSMSDYVYDKPHEKRTIEINHRIAFDKHTIQTVHPLLESRYKIRYNESGFNVIQFCPEDNMGDIFGGYLGGYLAKLHNKTYDVHCTGSSTPLRFSVTFALVGSIVNMALSDHWNQRIILGVGTISSGKLGRIGLRKDIKVLGVRGPKTRDQFIELGGINPSIVGDPGIFAYPLFKDVIDKARADAIVQKELCFISHYVDVGRFSSLLPQYRNVTISASAKGSSLENIFKTLATCKHIVSSSLHGVIFAHSMSIPAMPIQMSGKVFGGDHKFIDYYHGVKATAFEGRYRVTELGLPKSTDEWLELISHFPQPTFPVYPELDSSLLSNVFRGVV